MTPSTMLIAAISIVAYRVLQWLIGMAEKKVGYLWFDTINDWIAVLFGAEIARKNRVVHKMASWEYEQEYIYKTMRRLCKENPDIVPTVGRKWL
jgi:hypothetical protein